MPKEQAKSADNRRKPAGSDRGFPYIARCEALREAEADLATLRANAAKLRAKARPFGNRRFKQEVIANRRAPFRGAIRHLPLAQAAADQLLNDLMLIAAWYLLPARRAYMGTDVEGDRLSLRAMVRGFQKITLVHQLAAQNLVDALPAFEGSEDEMPNLSELFRQMDLFCSAADHVEQRFRGLAGRQAEARRDRTMQLVGSALHEVDAPIALSRGTNARPGYHFTSVGGALLLTFMRRLGWPDEAVLARAYERHRSRTR